MIFRCYGGVLQYFDTPSLFVTSTSIILWQSHFQQGKAWDRVRP